MINSNNCKIKTKNSNAQKQQKNNINQSFHKNTNSQRVSLRAQLKNRNKPYKKSPNTSKTRHDKRDNKKSLLSYTTTPTSELYKVGLAKCFFGDDVKTFSNDEVTEEQLIDLTEKLFKTDIGTKVFSYFAVKHKTWEKLILTKEQFAMKFSRCSSGELDKRFRRSHDQVIHLGGANFIGTFTDSFMDTLHKVYLDRDKNEGIKKEIIDLAFKKLKTEKELNMTAKWVKETANNLFGLVENSESPESTELLLLDNHEIKVSSEIRSILKGKINELSKNRPEDRKQADQIVSFLQRYLKRFEKLSNKKIKTKSLLKNKIRPKL
jgi:hypothetical protein